MLLLLLLLLLICTCPNYGSCLLNPNGFSYLNLLTKCRDRFLLVQILTGLELLLLLLLLQTFRLTWNNRKRDIVNGTELRNKTVVGMFPARDNTTLQLNGIDYFSFFVSSIGHAMFGMYLVTRYYSYKYNPRLFSRFDEFNFPTFVDLVSIQSVKASSLQIGVGRR